METAMKRGPTRISSMVTTRVRFQEGADGLLSLLEVEAVNVPDLPRRLTQALFEARVQVVHQEIAFHRRSVRIQLDVVEFDGARIEATRRFEVQRSLLSALDTASVPAGMTGKVTSAHKLGLGA
jgi:UTP:GlnB (protein PII) uridylyltransferase